MSKGLDKRKKIFNIYSEQLDILNELELLRENIGYKENIFICPICMNEFTELDLDSISPNMLTLEDAPPRSLGGHANTLTCKKCNSRCGHEIDFHLTERLIELDVRNFKPNTISKARITIKGEVVQAEVIVDKEGNTTIRHSEKNNHKEKLDRLMKSTKKSDLIELEFKASRVEKLRFESALLKSAYIMAFEKFGYSLIQKPAYDIIRDQLNNPDKEIYPEGFWTKQNTFKQEHEGVHKITTKGYEGYFAIFPLKTGISISRYGVYLPIKAEDTVSIIEKFKNQEGGFGLQLDPLSGKKFFEKDGIKEIASE